MSKIATFLIKNFELKPKEVSIFLLLFFHSFFLGWFLAFYFVSANSEFIAHFGSEDLPIAYMIAGIAGYLITALYSNLQKKLHSKTLFLGALLFMVIITFVGRAALGSFNIKWLSAFVFIWAWPFISLIGIEAGGLSLRFLNLVQVKRLFGLFNMGGVIAAILSYFAIPLLKPVIGHIYDLLYVGLGGLILSIVLLFMLYAKSDKKEKKIVTLKKKVKKEKSKTSFRVLLKDKYFVWIFLSATLSMTMIYITDFGFLSSVKSQIAPDDIALYLGLVFGALKVGEFFISLASRRLLSKYGVKLGLTILPTVATIIVFGATITGFTIGAGTIFFLILMTLNKSFERILRRGLDDPAFNILYQPLPEDRKLAVQTKVGVVMQISIAIAGVFLFFTNKILIISEGKFLLKFFPVLFLPILIAWFFVSRKLYLAYKSKIRQILSDISKDKRRGTDKYQFGSELLRKNLKNSNKVTVNFSTTVLSETNPKLLEAYAGTLLTTIDEIKFKKAILRNIEPTWRKRLSKTIQQIQENELPPDLEKIAAYAVENLDYSGIKKISEEEAQVLINSKKTADKLTLIKYINKRKYEAADEVILSLLDDDEKIVKMAAINLSSRFKSDKLILKLAELIQYPEYQHICANALLDLGSKVLPFLEEYFINQANINILMKVTEIYAKIGTSDAKSLLVKHLNYPEREIQLSVIWALYFCKYQASEEEAPLIKLKLDEVVENILWLYATIADIEQRKNTLKLFMALDFEKELNFELIFLLLSFLYEPRIITLIQKNIIGKDTIFALEIMDNFFSQDVKRIITPLFDDISAHQKLKRLNHLFPQKKMQFVERLKEIVIRDYQKIDVWSVTKAIELLGRLHKKHVSKQSKASAIKDYKDIKVWTKKQILKTLEKIRRSEMPDEIFVALYHSDELVYSTAAKIIHEENPIKCFDYLANMSPAKQKFMNILSNKGVMLSDKIRLIKRHPLFFHLPDNQIIKVAKLLKIKKVNKGETISIIYKNSDDIIIISKGTLVFNQGHENQQNFKKTDIIIRGINLDDFANVLTAENNAVLMIINRFDLFNIFISEREIILGILNNLHTSNWSL